MGDPCRSTAPRLLQRYTLPRPSTRRPQRPPPRPPTPAPPPPPPPPPPITTSTHGSHRLGRRLTSARSCSTQASATCASHRGALRRTAPSRRRSCRPPRQHARTHTCVRAAVRTTAHLHTRQPPPRPPSDLRTQLLHSSQRHPCVSSRRAPPHGALPPAAVAPRPTQDRAPAAATALASHQRRQWCATRGRAAVVPMSHGTPTVRTRAAPPTATSSDRSSSSRRRRRRCSRGTGAAQPPQCLGLR